MSGNSTGAVTEKASKRHSSAVSFPKMVILTFALMCVATLAAIWVTTDGRPFDPVAATAGDYRLYEDDVTKYIQTNRSNIGMSNDDDWGSYLSRNGYTPTSIRDSTITYFMRAHAIEEDARLHGITVTDGDIDKSISDTKGMHGYDDDEWTNQLSSMGYDEAEYRADVKRRLLSSRLEDEVIDKNSIGLESDAVINAILQDSSAVMQSKELSVIVLRDDEDDLANDLSSQLKGDASLFDDMKNEYGESDGYDGWTITSEASQDIAEQVSTLKKGDISDIIKLDGIEVIVKVSDDVEIDGDITSTEQLPSSLVSSIREALSQSKMSDKFTEYVDKLVADMDVHTNSMPSGLPYDVNVEDGASAGDGSSDTAADNN